MDIKKLRLLFERKSDIVTFYNNDKVDTEFYYKDIRPKYKDRLFIIRKSDDSDTEFILDYTCKDENEVRWSRHSFAAFITKLNTQYEFKFRIIKENVKNKNEYICYSTLIDNVEDEVLKTKILFLDNPDDYKDEYLEALATKTRTFKSVGTGLLRDPNKTYNNPTVKEKPKCLVCSTETKVRSFYMAKLCRPCKNKVENKVSQMLIDKEKRALFFNY